MELKFQPKYTYFNREISLYKLCREYKSFIPDNKNTYIEYLK